jgi:integrase
MATEKLTMAKVEPARRPGLLSDGGGLNLCVGPGGAKSWVFRFSHGGRQRRMGLGSLKTLNLREAREKARECRKLVDQGIDPIEQRRSERAIAATKRVMRFQDAAVAFIEAHEDGWTPAYARQWRDHFGAYVFSKIGALPMQAVNHTDVVLGVLEPLWKTRPETAWRIRGRLEMVIDWAKFRGFCTGENAARWKGHLAFHLQRPEKIRGIRHHPALPFLEIPGFLQKLRKRRGIVAVALEFTLFTVGRQSETRGAQWHEFDLDAGLWTIPASRMKMRREHRVALNEPALAILREVAWLKSSEDDFVFPGRKPGQPLSQHVMKTLMRAMGYNGVATAHGFRSSFKDWAHEQTDFPTEAIELALAHAVGNKVEAAYRRGDLLEKRRLLSKAWGDFCLGLTPLSASNVVPFPKPSTHARARTTQQLAFEFP